MAHETGVRGYLARTAPDELEDPVADAPRKAFRVADVANARFYAEHRQAILDAMGHGLVLRDDAAVPDGAELVTRGELPTFTTSQLAAMTPAEYSAVREDVLDAVRDGRLVSDKARARAEQERNA